jgi:hypothetical protein
MNDFQIGPGAICKCCHDDAQGIDDSGLCPSCRKYTAELRAENERLRTALADLTRRVRQHHRFHAETWDENVGDLLRDANAALAVGEE